MTGEEIFKTACAYLAGTPEENEDLKPAALQWLNALLAEALPYERAYRQVWGLSPLAAAPVLGGLEETVDMCEGITRAALPYGLASYLFLEDEQNSWAVSFRSRFISALQEAAPARQERIADVYGEG